MTALAGSIALVTGASRGIGAATAVELARLGAHVVITARTQGGLEETDDAIRAVGGSATLLPLDLAEGDQIDAIGPSIHQRFGRLDVLVHNAGALGRLTPVAHILPNDWADVIAVNLTAAWHLIRTCDPLLRNAAAGRAVFVTDERARAPKAYWGAYGATKAGMEHLVLTWADEVRTTPLRVNLFDPGSSATRLRATRCPARSPPRWRSPRGCAAAGRALLPRRKAARRPVALARGYPGTASQPGLMDSGEGATGSGPRGWTRPLVPHLAVTTKPLAKRWPRWCSGDMIEGVWRSSLNSRGITYQARIDRCWRREAVQNASPAGRYHPLPTLDLRGEAWVYGELGSGARIRVVRLADIDDEVLRPADMQLREHFST